MHPAFEVIENSENITWVRLKYPISYNGGVGNMTNGSITDKSTMDQSTMDRIITDRSTSNWRTTKGSTHDGSTCDRSTHNRSTHDGSTHNGSTCNGSTHNGWLSDIYIANNHSTQTTGTLQCTACNKNTSSLLNIFDQTRKLRCNPNPKK